MRHHLAGPGWLGPSWPTAAALEQALGGPFPAHECGSLPESSAPETRSRTGKQHGELVPGPGRIPRCPGPARIGAEGGKRRY